MTPPARGPAPARRAAIAALFASAVLLAAGLPAAATTTTTSAAKPWVAGQGGTLTIGIDQAPTGCNPNVASGDTWATRLILEPVLPSAFVENNSGQAVYDQAVITQAELQSTTPETVVYTINPKAVWSDGSPITAADFMYTWEDERGIAAPLGVTGTAGLPPTVGATVTTPTATSAPSATSYTGPSLGYRQIQSITPGNQGRTVTVVFSTPYADWYSLFSELLPASTIQSVGWNPDCSTLDPTIDLSGGPFELSSVARTKIVLDRNPKWWQTKPYLNQIVFKIASGPSQLASWLAAGKVKVALPNGFNQRYLERVSSLTKDASVSVLSDTLAELEFSATSPTTESATVRMAIAHAIDRRSLVDTVVGWEDSTIVPAASPLYTQAQSGYPSSKPAPLQVANQPGTTPTTAPTTPTAATPFPVTADAVQTAKLLDGLGYTKSAVTGGWDDPTGAPVTLRLAYDTADSWVAGSARIIDQQLVAAGFTVALLPEDNATATGMALSTGAADLAILPLHSDTYDSQAIAWYTPLLGAPGLSGSQDWSNLDDPVVDSLLVKASQELSPNTAQKKFYGPADAQLWTDMVALPLFDEPTVLAYSRSVAGAELGPNDSALLWSPTTWGIKVAPGSKKAAGS